MQNIQHLSSLYAAGNYQGCIACCEEILNSNPNDDLAFKWAGKSLLAVGQIEQAQQCLTRAHQLNQSDPEILKDIGNCLLNKGNYEQAAGAYQRALRLQPDYAPAIYNLAGVAQLSGDHKRGLELFLKAVELDPYLRQSWLEAAKCALSMGQWDTAITLASKAVAVNPSQKGAYQVKGDAHRSKGELNDALQAYQRESEQNPENPKALINAADILHTLNKPEEAIRLLRRALELKPDDVLILSNLGCMLNAAERHEEAAQCCQRSTLLNPNHAESYANFSLALFNLGRLDEALATNIKAVALQPNNPGFLANLAVIYEARGDHELAIKHHRQALALAPFDQEAHTGLACILLAKGEFSLGWNGYAYRTHKPQCRDLPVWDGSRREKVLVIGEQGVGDQILYASLIQEAQSMCEKLEVRVDQRLVPLFRRSFSGNITIDCLKTLEQETSCDSHIAIADLARLFRHEVSDFPDNSHGYLQADSTRSVELAEDLRGGCNHKLIGLSWNSEGRGYKNKSKSIALQKLATALHQIDAKLICLQYGNHHEEISSLRNAHGINIETVEGLDLYNDIDGTAALINACDAVVSISNMTAHLAGALGKETHLLVPRSPNFCWGLEGNCTIWYPSIKLYRQNRTGDWSEAIEAVADGLSEIGKTAMRKGDKNKSC
ncbi:tetratricopeptide repeat protein [Synechococcus sp. HK05]|uniref:tetratricopeptide repeat protein n=1 Tax=Synechococcus sp. HK05 TaxID=2725975 RepID=UPI001C38C056|nr:tetratricopeptide repeat protein [Synechococcus sp. HK05]